MIYIIIVRAPCIDVRVIIPVLHEKLVLKINIGRYYQDGFLYINGAFSGIFSVALQWNIYC